MKHVKLIGWASMLFLLLFVSCREGSTDIDKEIRIPDPIVLVNSSIQGQVIDENNDPVQSATIKVGTETITTDENGFFAVDGINMNKNGTHITASKSGYFFNSKMINPALGKESFVLFQLLDKVSIGSFNSTEGGTLSTSDGASVSFGANAIMHDNENVFNGEVQVYAKWLDPTHELIDARMPGDLRAIDLEQSLVQLATYGMLVVELETASGAPLQINAENEATITLPVPTQLLSSAPSSIPLWSFDEETGYWIEESVATLQDGKYVGEVPHFSFWNCDAPFPVVEFTATVVSETGDPIEFIKVSIEVAGADVRHAWTNSDGQVFGKIPKDEVLTLTVTDQCQEVVYTDEIGPFSAAVDLPAITVTELIQGTLSGTLLKCDGSAVTNGYAYIQGQLYDRFLHVDENGDFSQLTYFCEDNTLDIRGYDLDIPLTSEPVTLTVPAGGGDINLGTLEVCDVITETITVSIPELSYEKEFFIYSASVTNEGIDVQVEADSAYLNFGVFADANQIGDVEMITFNFSDYGDPDLQQFFFFCQGASGGSFDCPSVNIVTNDGTAGAFEGSFVGDFMSEGQGGSDTYEITVEFNVILQ